MKTHIKSHIAGFVSMVALAGLLAAPHSAFALGFALPDQDAFATARGNAFIATADDPAAVYYNPAGISQLEGAHASLGAYGIEYGSQYHSPSGVRTDSKDEWEVLPQFFSTYSFSNYNLTFGMGTYSPYGLRYEWPSSAPFVGEGETGSMEYITLNPVLAYQIIPGLSVAAGPTLNYSEVDLKENAFGFVNHFRGRDTAAGYNAGILWQPMAQHSFGATYRSATDMNYNGHATSFTGPGNIPSQANIHFPQEVAFGYSFRPTTNWNFEADGTWSDWSNLRSVGVNPQAALGDGLAFDYHPSWIASLGATRYWRNWHFSGGFMYSEDTVTAADFNPLVPDSDRYIFSLGVGQQYKHFSWDVAYQFAWGPSRQIGTDNFAPANGTYEFFSHALSVNVGYRF